MKKLMILGASILQLPAIEKSMQMGNDTIVVDINPDAIGFSVPGVKKVIVSTIDVEKVLETARKYNIDGIMTLATDMPMRSVAKVSKEMCLVGIDEETALKATNKSEMRKALKNYGVPVPKFYTVSNIEEYIEVVKKFEGSFIVKPVDSSGSRGIYEIKDFKNKELIYNAFEYSKSFSNNGDVIVEEYMEGPEVSVETLSINGECNVIQITDKLTTGAPHYVEIGHSQPTIHSKELVRRITDITIAANKAIGIESGPSHTEIIITNEGPKIVELGARLGGDNITTHLVPLSTGVDMVESCIKIALGEKVGVDIKCNKGAAIRYFSQHEGTIESIIGLDEAKKYPGIKQISVVHGVGEKITNIVSSGSRIGFVISQGNNSEAAIDNCIKALDKIKIKIIK